MYKTMLLRADLGVRGTLFGGKAQGKEWIFVIKPHTTSGEPAQDHSVTFPTLASKYVTVNVLKFGHQKAFKLLIFSSVFC